MLLGVVVLAWLQPGQTDGVLGFVGRLIDLAKLGLFLGAIGWIVYNIVAWRTAEYAVTNRRVRGREGLLKRRTTDSLLSSISDVQSRISALGRTLGYGNIRIMTASGDAGEDTFTSVRGVDAFRKELLEQKAGAGAMAEAAGRVAPASPVETAAPIAPPASAPTPTIADATATLGELAKLRDAGAITSEEYDSKKSEILARI
jgi:hypothetical protein